MDGFEKRREQKKNDIIKAALSLFQKYGVQKVTIDEIAKKAHVSQVTIYNYFESKDNLIYHVFKYYVDDIWEEQKEMLESDIPFNKKIEKIILDRKSTRLNSSHVAISYAVFCLKKKKKIENNNKYDITDMQVAIKEK